MTVGAAGADRPVAVLTGFMGSGKSTVGRALADRLGVDYVDTDAEIERRAGRRIPEIFADDGESAFRELERATVLEVLGRERGVVALGGGAVTVPEIATALAAHHVIYLEIDARAGFARVAASDRPLLRDPDPAGRYGELLAGRVDAYRAVAGHTVDATVAVATIVDQILNALPDPRIAPVPSADPKEEPTHE